MLDIVEIQNPATRANACRNRTGNARPFRSLPQNMKEQVEFVKQADGSLIAIWRHGGEGQEPPPYWMDADGGIHNL